MTARTWCAVVAPLMLACADLPAGAQQLAQRVASAAGSRVQFSFATRVGVCGDGRTYIHTASSDNSSFYGSFNDMTAEPCQHGPARVVLDRAGNEVVGLRVFVGPPTADGVTDLGTVSVRDAADYLMHLASTAEGAVARDAIMPAMLADSVNNNDALVAMARDKSLARDVRRSALSWLGNNDAAPASLVKTLLDIGTDDADNQNVRGQALSTLARLNGGAGIPALIQLANDSQGGWVARTALTVIARSGDPRAREYLRGVVQNATLPDEALGIAVRGFGQTYTTAADIKTIREAWPKFSGDRAQSAAIAAVAEFGGSDNAAWLLSLARNMNTTASIRRRALSASTQAGATTSDLISLYDGTTDPDTKTAIISALATIGDRASTDKLLAIAKQDDSVAARRRAISVLGQSSDPRVKDALAGIAIGR